MNRRRFFTGLFGVGAVAVASNKADVIIKMPTCESPVAWLNGRWLYLSEGRPVDVGDKDWIRLTPYTRSLFERYGGCSWNGYSYVFRPGIGPIRPRRISRIVWDLLDPVMKRALAARTPYET